MKNRVVIRVISIILAVMLCMVPLSLGAAAAPDQRSMVSAPVGELIVEELVKIIWDTLAGWGIEILFGEEFDYTVEQWLYNEILEYLDTELDQTWDAWVSLMQFVRDPWGRGIGNNYFIESIWDFTVWLQNKYNLGSNQNHTIGGSYEIGELVVYQTPMTLWINNSGAGVYNGWTITWTSGAAPVYCAFYSQSSHTEPPYTQLLPYFFSSAPFTITQQTFNANGIGNTPSSWDVNTASENGWYEKYGYFQYIRQESNNNIYYYLIDEIIAALTVHNQVSSGNPITIITQTIELPGDSPEYQPGYSIIYFPDGSIGYIDIAWPQSMSVNNLPVAIMPTSLGTAPDVQQASLPINGFARTYAEGIELVSSIMYELPSPLVAMALAIIAATVVFGAIHAFKEH